MTIPNKLGMSGASRSQTSSEPTLYSISLRTTSSAVAAGLIVWTSRSLKAKNIGDKHDVSGPRFALRTFHGGSYGQGLQGSLLPPSREMNQASGGSSLRESRKTGSGD